MLSGTAAVSFSGRRTMSEILSGRRDYRRDERKESVYGKPVGAITVRTKKTKYMGVQST